MLCKNIHNGLKIYKKRFLYIKLITLILSTLLDKTIWDCVILSYPLPRRNVLFMSNHHRAEAEGGRSGCLIII